MVILWTDALIFLLLFGLSALIFVMSRKATLQRPLKNIMGSKTGMASMVVLLFFMMIGLLDSIHFEDKTSRQNNIISVLDYLNSHLIERSEKTYSAPFAAHLYSKENMTDEVGKGVWGYPRLQYGGAHLTDPAQEKATDIFLKTLAGFVKGLFSFMGLTILVWGICWLLKRPFHVKALLKTPVIVLFLLLAITGMLFELSQYYHVFGTDKVGEDVFYQAIKSIRTGLVIGCLTTMIMLPLAIIFGIMAGYFRGWVDDIIQFIYTTLNSIPGVLLIAASILMVQVYMSNHADEFNNLLLRADMRLLFLCMILGVTSWTGLCRLLRAETLKLREMEYVQAAQALGVTRTMILFRHILPNVMHIVLISVVLDFSALVLAEAVLSYINIGVDPTTYSWGNMINGARLEMARDPLVWWSLTASFVFMFSLVLAANLFADTVRNAFDPRRVENG